MNPEEAREAAVRTTRNRILGNAPAGTEVSAGIVRQVEQSDHTWRLYNSVTRVRRPCSEVWEHWIHRYTVVHRIEYDVTLPAPDGRVLRILAASRAYRVEEWVFKEYLDCGEGAEDLPPIPDNYASLHLDGVPVWTGQAAMVVGGDFAAGSPPAILLGMAKDLVYASSAEPEPPEVQLPEPPEQRLPKNPPESC